MSSTRLNTNLKFSKIQTLVGDVENHTINEGGHSLILKEEVFLSAVQTRFREGVCTASVT